MYLAEIYDKADFCNIVKRIVGTDRGHVSFVAGSIVDRLADENDFPECEERYDYRIIEVDEV